MLKEFREFALKGSMVDLAVGIVIGAAVGSVINSLVTDILMPPIGLLLGKVDFQNMFITLWGQHFNTLAEAKAGGAVTINYGIFVNNSINFMIVAFTIFILIKQISKVRRKPATANKECLYCRMAINKDAIRCPYCTTELKSK